MTAITTTIKKYRNFINDNKIIGEKTISEVESGTNIIKIDDKEVVVFIAGGENTHSAVYDIANDNAMFFLYEDELDLLFAQKLLAELIIDKMAAELTSIDSKIKNFGKSEKRVEFESTLWSFNETGQSNPKADPNCNICKGHGIVDDGNMLGAIMVNCFNCWT